MVKWLMSQEKVPDARRLLLLLVLVCTLTSTSYFAGLSVDDHFHRLILQHPGELEAIPTNGFDIFKFVPREGPERARMFEVGVLPWWTSPRFTIAFYRPVSALFHRLDYALWPDSVVTMHIQSQLWLCLLIGCALALYKKLLSGRTAWFATILFAIDDAHGEAVGWLAGRNALIAGVFGLAAFYAHFTACRAPRTRAWCCAFLGFLLYAAALGSGEIAMGALGYIVSYTLFLDRRPRTLRIVHCGAYVALTACWQLLCRTHGYGAAGTDLYIDPWATPFKFAMHAVLRVPFLLAGQLALPPADLWSFESQGVRLGIALLGVALLALLFWQGRHAMRRDQEVRFWALGSLVSLVPACAKIPSDRLLVFFGFGVFGYLAKTWRMDGESPMLQRLTRGLVFAGAALSLILLPVRSFGLRWIESQMASAIRELPQDEAISGQTLIIVNSPHPFLNMAIPVWLTSWRRPRAANYLSFGLSTTDVNVRRTGTNTLRVTPQGGFFGTAFDGILRQKSETIPAGFSVRQSGARLEVVRLLPDGRPAELEVTFERDLDSPHYRWVTWRNGAFRETRPPPLFETLTVPGARLDE